MFTLTVLIGLYVQGHHQARALRAGIGFIPFVIVLWVSGWLPVAAGELLFPACSSSPAALVLGAMIYGSTLNAPVLVIRSPSAVRHGMIVVPPGPCRPSQVL